jgi:diguanylate cyclase (GGDEF)-like protein
LTELATTDGLTGLVNHRTFKDRLREEFSRAGRYEIPLSLMMLDVDKFKQFNDAFGHPAGDDVLRRVANILQDTTRDTDLVGRYGGEEFIVLLPYTSRDAALGLAERIRASVEGEEWEKRSITMSIGVVTLTPQIADSAIFVSEADEALYHSKLTGRNRVTHADEMPRKVPSGVFPAEKES